MMLAAEQGGSPPDYFKDILDPHRPKERRHPLPVVLAIAAGATPCGMDGDNPMGGWVRDLSANARERFGCRIENQKRLVPSGSVIRDMLARIDPHEFDQ